MIVVTIPAYNEGKTIEKAITDIHDVMANKYDYKVLVVNDGSTDNTAEVASKRATVISHSRNRGLAAAFRTEMEEALKMGADIIVHFDADNQYVASEIPKLLDVYNKGKYDLVLGSRFMGKIEKMPAMKRWGNKAFSKVLSRITKLKITDGQTGFRVFNKKIAKLPITSKYTYTQQQIIEAALEGCSIKETPITFKKRADKSHLMKGPIDYAVKAWVTILRTYRDYEPLKFFGAAGFSLLIVGGILAAYFTTMHFTTGIQGHVPSLIAMMLFIVTGFQVLLFGFLADMRRR